MKKLLLIALLLCIKQLNAQCSLTISGNTVICSGTSTTLIASGATNYTWMPANIYTSTISIAPSTATVYTVTGTTGTCTATNIFTVTVNPIPTMTVTSPAPYCPGDFVSSSDYNITTNPPSGVTYNWTANNHTGTGMPANGTGAAPAASYVASANSSLVNQISVITYTPSALGCIGLAVTETVTIKPTPIVQPMADQGWCPGAMTTQVPLSSFPTTPSTTYVYSYNAGGGVPSVGNTNPFPSLMTFNSGLTTISTVVSVTPTLNGCVGPPSGFTIYVYPSPIAKFSASMHVCDGGQMQFSDLSVPNTGSVTVNQWAWDFNNDGSIDASFENPSYIYPAGSVGTNTVTLYIGTSSAPSCTAQVTAPVYINPVPVADFVGDSLQGCSVMHTDFTNLTTITPFTQLQCYWSFGNGNTSFAMSPPQQAYSNSSTTQNAYYTVSLTATTDSGCVATKTKTNYIDVLACAGNGIEKYSGSNEANIYPNPSNGNFVIETSSTDKQSLQIIDITGKLVLQQTVIGKTTIDASSLDNGIYFMQLNTGEGFYSKKIIVQH